MTLVANEHVFVGALVVLDRGTITQNYVTVMWLGKHYAKVKSQGHEWEVMRNRLS